MFTTYSDSDIRSLAIPDIELGAQADEALRERDRALAAAMNWDLTHEARAAASSRAEAASATLQAIAGERQSSANRRASRAHTALIKRYEPLIGKLVGGIGGDAGRRRGDLMQEGRTACSTAIAAWDPGRGHFAPLATVVIRRELQRSAIAHQKDAARSTQLDFAGDERRALPTAPSADADLLLAELVATVAAAVAGLTAVQTAAISYHAAIPTERPTRADLARYLDISPQELRRAERSGLTVLRQNATLAALF